jgi:hypothetical protein
MSVVLLLLASSACAVSPPMVDVVASPTPGPCEAAFAALIDASSDEREQLVTATLDECSLEAWHQQNERLMPTLPGGRAADPSEQLAMLCVDQRWSSTSVCEEARP